MHRCVSALEIAGDEASNTKNYDDAIVAYSTALSLGHSTPTCILMKWAGMVLIRGSVDEALATATKVYSTSRSEARH